MENVQLLLMTILLFLVITFFLWKITIGYANKAHGKKVLKQWGAKTYYWSSVLFFSGGITVLLISII